MNPGTLVIVNLLGGVALLLWGVRMVRTGITRGWGDRLQQFLAQRLGNRVSAFLAGTAATMVLGSGTATSLIVSNIAAAGGLPVYLGLSVLLGADVGSAVTTTLFASGSSIIKSLAPLLLFLGYVIFTTSREFRPHAMGRILIGVGLMMQALQLISLATQPLNAASLFHSVLAAIGNETLIAFLVGALMAWAFHSTLAAVLVVGSLVANASMGLQAAGAFILGINLGGGFPAVVGALSLPSEARKLAVANLVCRGLLCVVALPYLPYVTRFLEARQITGLTGALALHLGLNVAAGLVWLPLAHAGGRLAGLLMPGGNEPPDPLSSPRYLSVTALDTPAIALANAGLEIGRMSEVLDRMFATALTAMRSSSTETLKELRPQDQRLNAYQAAIQTYLSDLTQRSLSPEQTRHALEMVLYTSNLEHAGDIIQLNLADRIKAKVREGHQFSDSEQAALEELTTMIHANIRFAASVLASRDVAGAQALVAQKDAFRALEQKAITQQISRRDGSRGQALRQRALFVDLIRDLHRVNSHIVAAGYPIVDSAGLLRDSRLRKHAKT